MSLLFTGFAFFRRSLIAQIIAGVLAFLAMWKVNNMVVSHNAGKAKEKEIADNTRKIGKKRNEQARKVRKKAEQEGSFDRLLDHHCRDC